MSREASLDADFDVGALSTYLRREMGDLRLPITATRFNAGQSNPTYLLEDAGGRRLVLRKRPAGELLPSAHAVDREYRIMAALRGTDIPVPSPYCYCGDSDVIGTPFYVMEFLEGRIFWDPALPGLEPATRRAIYDDMNRVVAALHTVDFAALGLSDYGRSGKFFARQVRRWTSQYQASAVDPIEAMDRLMEWLPNHIPTDDRTTLFHGDLRLDNMIFHPTQPRVIGLLDWELSTLGHPVADLAYHSLPWHLTSSQFRGMAERAPLPEGIPSEETYLRDYSRRTGTAIVPDQFAFCVAYSLFRLAAILQGIYKRSLEGTASGPGARETGQKARPIAEVAWNQVKTHFGVTN